MDEKLIDLLKKTNIIVENEGFINGMVIPREILLNNSKFDELEKRNK